MDLTGQVRSSVDLTSQVGDGISLIGQVKVQFVRSEDVFA